MKLLKTNSENTKIKKSENGSEYRIASLSMMPDNKICPSSKAAGCFDSCLKSAGMGIFKNVAAGRQARSDYWHDDQPAFLAQLMREISNFRKLCHKQGKKPAIRLNTISDIAWEKYGIPQAFPDVKFYDYTKRANRLGKTPPNYQLIFSYSGRSQYQNQVAMALKTGCPIAVVFNGDMPAEYMGRRVIDGDKSDLVNVDSGKVIIGLKAKGKAKNDNSGFVINADIIPAVMVAA